jgi:dipeptidyl aminopeptidase/acylaminoacyl peptidase
MKKLLLAALLIASTAFADQLTVDWIARDPELFGYTPRNVRWSPDSKRVFFEWKERTRPLEAKYDMYAVDRDGRNLRKLSDDEAKDAPPSDASWTRDRRRAVFIDDDDVVLYDGAKHRNLTSTNEAESSPRFTRDERHVAFVRGDNLFVLSLDDASVVQLTNIAAADAKGPYIDLFEDKEKKKSASQKWIEGEERKLIGTVDRRAKEKEAEEARERAEHPRKPFKLDAKQSVADLQLAPDGKSVLAFLRTEPLKGKKTIVPDYVTRSAYTETIPSRQKVGDELPATKLARLDVTTGEQTWIDLGVDPAPQAKSEAAKNDTVAKTAEASSATGETKEEAVAGKSRQVGIEDFQWSDDGRHAIIDVRAADNKDRWIVAFDPSTLKSRILVTMHDPAWVNNSLATELGWLRDSATVWYLSEASGFSHLYTIPWTGGTPAQRTDGKWEVTGARLSNDGKSFELTTSEASLHEHHFYRLPVAGGARVRLTSIAGMHDVTPSPDGTTLADIYSFTTKPPDLYLQAARADAAPLRVTTSPSPELASHAWLDAPIVRIPARDGAQVPAHIYKPANFARGGPAVIFVHGAGYLQNVTRGWSYYQHEYLFHHLLMERGYLVLDLDYRGSAGYGRDWRTAIYEHMGGKDLEDHVDAAHRLVTEHGVDPQRIGIYGGSYGGFITLMAMFTTPGTFAAGAALRPVTDWAHYNAPYTSNILNDPQSDPEAYRRSSPIYFAEGLKGALLICHGMVDTNVHFQDTVRLTQRLIELRKEGWEVAMYPVENHGFVEASSWADEYKRILRIFDEALVLSPKS